MVWSGQEIVTATGAVASAPVADMAFESVGTDSRAVAAGALFVALRGAHHDAHRFVAEALRQGAAAALVEDPPPGVDPARLLRVPDTLRALGDLAAFTRRRWGGPLAAITGSNGKTTTKEMLAAIAAADGRLRGRTLATHGNLNNLIGLPLTLLRLRGDEAAAIVEMGMNAPGEIARMTAIAAPTIGVITNVGPAHLEGLGSVDGVAAAKGELFAGLGATATIAVNREDEHIVRLAAHFPGRRIEFGHGGEVWADAIDDRGFDGVDFTLRVGALHTRVRLRMAGRHNVQNALAAAALAHGLGLDVETMAAGLSAAAPPKMRLEVARLANGVTGVNDAYNANPASTEAALDTLARMPGRHIAVLGEMRELGAAAGALHRQVGAYAAACGVQWLIAVGPQGDALAAGARAAGSIEVDECPDAAAAAALVAARWRRGDVVLVKGSRGPDDEPGVRRYGARMAEVAARLQAAAGEQA